MAEVIGSPQEGLFNPIEFTQVLRSLINPSVDSDGNPVDAQVTDPELVRIAKTAGQQRNQTPQRLQDLLNKGDDFYMEDKVDEEQWQVLAGVLATAKERLALLTPATGGEMTPSGHEERIRRTTGVVTDQEFAEAEMRGREIAERAPAGAEARRVYVMQILERIEANDQALTEYTNIYDAAALSTMIKNEMLERSLANEVRARLALHHCAALAGDIPGKAEEQISYLFSIFNRAQSRAWALEAEDFSCLLKEGLPGLRIKFAFETLQKAAREGLRLGGGKKVRYKEKGSSRTEQEQLKEEIISLIQGAGRDRRAARKSYQLAERVAVATFETSVWNSDLLDNDPLAEAIYLKEYREGRAFVGRDRGPSITIPLIPTLGTSFLRSLTVNSDELKSLAHKSESERRKRMDEINRTEILELEEIDWTNLDPGAYRGWAGITLPRILVAKGMLLRSTWNTKEFSSDAVEGMVAPMRAADPEQVLRVRTLFVLGALYATYTNIEEAIANGWDGIAWAATKRNLIHAYDPSLPESSLLNKKQLDWILETLKNIYRVDIPHLAALVGTRKALQGKYV